jgi:hypothetical protein
LTAIAAERKRERMMMLGIDDPWIILGYALAIGSAIVGVIYGWLYWNRDD